jgi:hypothetical protein
MTRLDESLVQQQQLLARDDPWIAPHAHQTLKGIEAEHRAVELVSGAGVHRPLGAKDERLRLGTHHRSSGRLRTVPNVW